MQLSAAQHLPKLSGSEGARGNLFVNLRPRISTGKFLSEENIHSFLKKSRGWKNVQENPETTCTVAGLLDKFADGGAPRTLAWFHPPSDKLPQELVRGMAVLADEENATVGQHREDDHRAGVCNNFPGGADTAGF
jgi:hypothetical protein